MRHMHTYKEKLKHLVSYPYTITTKPKHSICGKREMESRTSEKFPNIINCVLVLVNILHKTVTSSKQNDWR